jgi:heptosyltransferase-2
MVVKILVIHVGAIGDLVLSLPVFRILRDRFPRARIEILGRPSVAALARDGRHADAVHDWERPRIASLFTPAGPIPEDLRRFLGPFDLAVSFVSDPDGILRRNLEQAGIDRVVRTSVRPEPGTGTHAADRAARGLAPLGVAVPERVIPEIRPPADWIEQANRFLTSRGVRKPPITLHPGSGSRSKNWPGEAFAAVLDRLDLPRSVPVLEVRGEADADRGDAFRCAPGTRPHALARELPLPTLAAILARSRLHLGNDSGITHLAAAVGAPTVAIFGPTDPAQWAPRGPRVRILRGSPDPGGPGVSPDDPSPDDVAAACREWIGMESLPRVPPERGV